MQCVSFNDIIQIVIIIDNFIEVGFDSDEMGRYTDIRNHCARLLLFCAMNNYVMLSTGIRFY